MIKVKDLYVYPKYQRLVIKSVLKKAVKFKPELARPLYVFARPCKNTTQNHVPRFSVADGQHTALLAMLLSTKGENQELPCQVIEHDQHMTEEECIKAEAKMFKDLNQFRSNVSVIDTLRANISLGENDALETLERLNNMGVHVEKLGNESGPEVYGYAKLMSAYNIYGLVCVLSAIELYQKLQNDKRFPKWNDINKPLNGGLIAGIAAVYHLINTELGKGDRAWSVHCFLEGYMGRTNPTTRKNSLVCGTAGGSQSVLIARRIVDAVNNSTDLGIIVKRDGTEFSNGINETTMTNAGLGDPSLRVKA
jgi:hypothetical protein